MVRSHHSCLAFSGVIRDQMRELGPFCSDHDFDRNQVIYFTGDPPDALFQVAHGRVKVVRVSPEGKEKIIDIYQAGDFFGELCICGSGRRSDQAIALEPVRVTSIKVQALLQIMSRNSSLTLDLLQLVCQRLAEYQDHIATLAFDHVPVRLAREILRLSQAPGCERINGSVKLNVTLTHEEIAQLVGTSREIVTTLMNKFRQEGLLDYDRRSIHVHPDKLQGYVREH